MSTITSGAGPTLFEGGRLRLERERRGHAAFARTRRRAYVESREVLDRLDRYAAGGSFVETEDDLRRPLVVTGEPGSGKSALLAHWEARYLNDHPDTIVISHFIGAGTLGADLWGMLRHIMLELSDRLDIPEEIAENPEDLPDQFLGWVPWLRGRRVILIVDALNQLRGDLSPEKILCWIPPELGESLRILFSTLEGPILTATRGLAWNELTVEPLSEKERHEVARRFIGGESRYSGLRTGQIQQVTTSRRSSNPLFLRTSLEELRLRNRNPSTNEKSDEYLEADSLQTLFDRILVRIESEFGVRLVSTALRMIHASRNGLSRDELVDICGVREERINRLLAALDYQLILRDDLYTFFHDHLRQAVEVRYASTLQSRKAAHRRLGVYFRTFPVDRRRADEEPHAWRAAGRLDELEKTLCSLPLVDYLWRSGERYNVLECWREVRERRQVTIEEAYTEELYKTEEISYHETVAELSFEAAEYPETERILRLGLERIGEQHRSTPRTIRMRLLLGNSIRESGGWDQAGDILRGVLVDAEEMFGADSTEVANIIDALATIYYQRGEYEQAVGMSERAHSVLRAALGEEHVDTINALINIAAGYLELHQYERQNPLYTEMLERCERVVGREHPLTALVLHNYGMTLQRQGFYLESRDPLEESLTITRRVYGDQHVKVSQRLRGLSSVDRVLGNYDEAERKLKESLEIEISKRGKDHDMVALALTNLATTYSEAGRYKESEEYCRKVLVMRERLYDQDHSKVHRVRLNLANTLIKQNRYAEALPYLQRSSLPMCRRYGPDNKWSKIWIDRYLDVLKHLGSVDEAAEVKRVWDSLTTPASA